MCGILGVLSAKPIAKEHFALALHTLDHRGPDDFGVWQDERNNLLLGQTRLSILDLTSAGHQPMRSACGRFVIVFNGEIYNHLSLRQQLGAAAPMWRGHSDTETILACVAAWGIEKTLKNAVGMFALAIWDGDEDTLYLARDRFGEKPLYYGE